MRTLRLAVALAVVLALTSFGITKEAQALPRDQIIINYYDCGFNNIGTDWRDCSGHWNYFGTHSGAAYRETDQTECSTGNPVFYGWEYWDDTTNTWQPYTGGQSCYCGEQTIPATC